MRPVVAAADAAAEGLDTVVRVRELDGERLDVEAGAFDAVVSRLGLIYFPDRAAALAGQYRALRHGGRVAAVVYSTAERNAFFAVPVSVIRRRAQLPAPAPGQPGPFSMGGPGVLEDALRQAGFRDVGARTVAAPLRLPSAAECVRFERESFGALHQMLGGLTTAERDRAWQEITEKLAAYETGDGFEGPCELVVAWGVK
ncbi:MAG: class I SAM-dependent methyltransferase [Actinomycetota bacterium]|nr:class I SAM-dependent methyltransferase [Actinomycetota bacterium]